MAPALSGSAISGAPGSNNCVSEVAELASSSPVASSPTQVRGRAGRLVLSLLVLLAIRVVVGGVLIALMAPSAGPVSSRA
ncbi:hypothetical protein GCM10009608_51120 [Pseudonocardia alaniniphila]